MIEEYSKKIEDNLYNKENLAKIMYDFTVEVDYDIRQIYLLINRNFITYYNYLCLLHSYLDTLNLSEEDILFKKFDVISKRTSISGKSSSNRYFAVLDGIVNENNPDVILQKLCNSDVDISHLKSLVFDYVIVRGLSNVDTSTIELKNKIDIYINRKNEINSERKKRKLDIAYENLLPSAQKVISEFINSDSKSKQAFLNENNLDTKTFDLYLTILFEKDQTLYNKYYDKMENERDKRYAILSSKIKKMVDYIKNGIEFNDQKRDFDMIDYYLLTSIKPDMLSKIASEILNKEDIIVLRRFLGKNKNLGNVGSNEVTRILNSDVEVFCEKDKDGYSIPGTGRIITKEEKLYIIDFLKQNNIPLSTKTYNLAFKRYLIGNLSNQIEEDNNLVL